LDAHTFEDTNSVTKQAIVRYVWEHTRDVREAIAIAKIVDTSVIIMRAINCQNQLHLGLVVCLVIQDQILPVLKNQVLKHTVLE
jgi:hypothetical protein